MTAAGFEPMPWWSLCHPPPPFTCTIYLSNLLPSTFTIHLYHPPHHLPSPSKSSIHLSLLPSLATSNMYHHLLPPTTSAIYLHLLRHLPPPSTPVAYLHHRPPPPTSTTYLYYSDMPISTSLGHFHVIHCTRRDMAVSDSSIGVCVRGIYHEWTNIGA